jgi:hypothetical protein
MNRLHVTQQQLCDNAIEKEEMRRLVALIQSEMGIEELDNQINNHLSDVIETAGRNSEAAMLLETLVRRENRKQRG